MESSSISSEQMVRWRTVKSQRNHLDERNFLTTVVINIWPQSQSLQNVPMMVLEALTCLPLKSRITLTEPECHQLSSPTRVRPTLNLARPFQPGAYASTWILSSAQPGVEKSFATMLSSSRMWKMTFKERVHAGSASQA